MYLEVCYYSSAYITIEYPDRGIGGVIQFTPGYIGVNGQEELHIQDRRLNTQSLQTGSPVDVLKFDV